MGVHSHEQIELLRDADGVGVGAAPDGMFFNQFSIRAFLSMLLWLDKVTGTTGRRGA